MLYLCAHIVFFMRILCFICAVCLSATLSIHASVVRIQVKGGNQETVKCYEPSGKPVSLPLDSSGVALWQIDNTVPVYVQVNYNYATYTLWLPASAHLAVDIDGASTPARFLKAKGTAEEVNSYLNAQPYRSTEINDASLEEEAFIQKTDSLLRANAVCLDAAVLPEAFKEMERRRMQYYTYRTLPDFPTYHRRITGDESYRPSARFWALLDALMNDGIDCLDMEEYRTLAYEAFGCKARHLFPTLKGAERLEAFLEQEKPADVLAEFLVYRTQIGFLNRGQTPDFNPYESLFSRYVKHEAWKEEVEALLAGFWQLAVGAPSPDFVCTDAEGRTVTLSAFRGKFVYIDLWATWCGPCVKEIPHLAHLEEDLGKEDIYFVSISCDANREAWLKRVRRGDLKGVQLHFSPGNDFLNAYKVTGIPRFILLDREGRILSADMSRPSMPETRQRLEALLSE